MIKISSSSRADFEDEDPGQTQKEAMDSPSSSKKAGDARRAIQVGKEYFITISSLLMYCKANGSRSSLHFSDGRKYSVLRNLTTIHESLHQLDLIRISPHSLVYHRHIVALTAGVQPFAIMRDGEELEISRRQQKDLRERFKFL